MERKLKKLFPQIVGVYTNDQHSFPMEKIWVDKCYDLKKTIEPGGKNWISQTVYNTEDKCDLNNDETFDQLTNFLKDCALDYCKELNYEGLLLHRNSFFNIYKQGDYQDWHNHINSQLSGVYCLSGKKGSAKIFFTDFNFEKIRFSISKKTENNSAVWQEEFVPGRFFLFRSDLLHCVQRHELDSPRLSIATNFLIVTPPV